MSVSFSVFFVASCLFSIGLFGVLISTRNIITILLSVEVLLLAAVFNFCGVSANPLEGHIFAILVITMAAAEAAVALAIIVVYFKKTENIDVKKLNRLKH